ncbi:MAG: alkaline phosphatase family protein [Chloroflexi bacterium]|nr:alkaline phosphatase family protein [Chloroflexota bacterium]
MRFSFAGLILILLIGALGLQGQENPPPPPEYILLISLDGARPDAIQQVDTPNLDTLAARGSSTLSALTVSPSVTIPAHTSMLTGLDVSEHGVVHNDYSDIPVGAKTFLLTTHEAGYPTAIVAGKEKLVQFRQHDDIPFVFARSGDASVVDAATTLLDDGYRVLLVHFPNPDYFGHLLGWMSRPYLWELENTDFQVGRLLDWYEANHVLDETLIVVTADHGGHGFGHGEDTPEDRLIPWIAAGPGIKANYTIQEPVSVADSAHTILYALDLERPESTVGKIPLEIFIDPVPLPES